jgi:hypothetical protein
VDVGRSPELGAQEPQLVATEHLDDVVGGETPSQQRLVAQRRRCSVVDLSAATNPRSPFVGTSR